MDSYLHTERLIQCNVKWNNLAMRVVEDRQPEDRQPEDRQPEDRQAVDCQWKRVLNPPADNPPQVSYTKLSFLNRRHLLLAGMSTWGQKHKETKNTTFNNLQVPVPNMVLIRLTN